MTVLVSPWNLPAAVWVVLLVLPAAAWVVLLALTAEPGVVLLVLPKYTREELLAISWSQPEAEFVLPLFYPETVS